MKIIVFSGTREGRELAEYLNSIKVPAIISVATEYGREIMNDMEYVSVHTGRLDKKEIIDFIKNADLVIDATHPYAKIVTQNVYNSCYELGIEYVRLLREETFEEDIITVNNIEEAVDILKNTKGNIFVSTGVKELHKYCEIDGYKNRVAARVLPAKESADKCERLGFINVIYKKGPFGYSENIEEFKKFNIKWLVTKNSGKIGGFDDKISAAKKLAINIIVIKRPLEHNGMSFEQVKKVIDKKLNKIKRFPLFIDISDKDVVVIGGGNIAVRRINSLLKFGAKIKVIALKFDKTKIDDFETSNIEFINKEFEPADLNNAFMVIGATNNRDVNHSIYKLCQGKNILCNIVDCKEECNFYFPAVCMNDNLSIGVVSDGNNHKLVKKTAKKIREIINEE